MKQFDSPKAKASDFEAALEGLADDLENSDVDEMELEDDEEDSQHDEGDEEIISGQIEMTEEEKRALEEKVKPVRQVLLKVLFISWQD
jgi:hypothetical protein